MTIAVIHSLELTTARLPTSNAPEVTTVQGAAFPVASLAFDASTEETCYFPFRAVGYANGNVTVRLRWYADTANSGGVAFGCSLAAITPNADTQDVETKTFATEVVGTDTHLGTTGQRLHDMSVEVNALDSIADGDWVVLRLARKVGNAADTMTGDAQLVEVTIHYNGPATLEIDSISDATGDLALSADGSVFVQSGVAAVSVSPNAVELAADQNYVLLDDATFAVGGTGASVDNILIDNTQLALTFDGTATLTVTDGDITVTAADAITLTGSVIELAGGLQYSRTLYTSASTQLNGASPTHYIDATAGNVNVTLPNLATAHKQYLIIKRTDATANTCTLTRAGTDVFAGGSTTFAMAGNSTVILHGISGVWHLTQPFGGDGAHLKLNASGNVNVTAANDINLSATANLIAGAPTGYAEFGGFTSYVYSDGVDITLNNGFDVQAASDILLDSSGSVTLAANTTIDLAASSNVTVSTSGAGTYVGLEATAAGSLVYLSSGTGGTSLDSNGTISIDGADVQVDATGIVGILSDDSVQLIAAGLGTLTVDDTNITLAANNVTVTGALRLTADISPAQLTANTNNWSPTGLATATVIRVFTDASRDLTGIALGADGRQLYLLNTGSTNSLVLKHESANSDAANRFDLPAAADKTLGPRCCAHLHYDATSSRWRLLSLTS